METSRTLKLDKKDLTQGIPTDGSADRSSPEYIVPPGLYRYIIRFWAHYDTAGKMPIMIVGDTGVGKRLFLHLFEKFYKEKNSSAKVKYVNCALLGGGDPKLVKSELFGHVKGAFTDAKKETSGAFGDANGGALILDEIGGTSSRCPSHAFNFSRNRKILQVG